MSSSTYLVLLLEVHRSNPRVGDKIATAVIYVRSYWQINTGNNLPCKSRVNDGDVLLFLVFRTTLPVLWGQVHCNSKSFFPHNESAVKASKRVSAARWIGWCRRCFGECKPCSFCSIPRIREIDGSESTAGLRTRRTWLKPGPKSRANQPLCWTGPVLFV